MRSHKDKFFATLEAAAKENGLELIVDYDYANNGVFTISFEDSYDPIVKVKFNFQTGGQDPRASFEGINNPERAERLKTMMNKPPDENWTSGWYLKPDEFPQVIKAIRTEMAKAINERQAAEIASFK